MSDSRRGTSLLEVMIAAAVIAIGLTALAAAMIAVKNARDATRAEVLAVNAARFAIEEILAIDDFEYVRDQLGGFTFRVTELEAPDFTRSYADGSMPSFPRSDPLPSVIEGVVVEPTTGASFDPVGDTDWDHVGLALEPADDEDDVERAWGTVSVSALATDLLEVTVTIHYRSSSGNRKFSLYAHKLESVDADAFEF